MLQHKDSKNTLFLLLLLCSAISFAQVKLNNKVVEFGFDNPIESASVYIKSTAIGTVTNVDGNFSLRVPKENETDTLVVSSIGYSTVKIAIPEYNPEEVIYLEQEVASLDEVTIEAEPRPKTGNDIVLKALEKLPKTMPDSSYIQKGFLRHKERNKIEFKWLIESAITVYDSSNLSKAKDYLKVNVDQQRKSYDLRDIDSLFSYASYLNQNSRRRVTAKDLKRNRIKTSALKKAIKWNDNRINGLQNIFQGKLNLLRNVNTTKALFGNNILDTHQFELDTVLVDNGRKLYKIKIDKSNDFVGLNTKGIYNEGYHANGWLYIYWDNYAFKKIEYELLAASKAQKDRSKRLFDTQVNHKLVITYIEYQDKMYPNYIYYETPKLVNVAIKSKKRLTKEEEERYKEERYYYTVQEILFSEIILDDEVVKLELDKEWDMDIFSAKPYNKEFWESYNVLLESEEDEEMIEDLTQRASLFKE